MHQPHWFTLACVAILPLSIGCDGGIDSPTDQLDTQGRISIDANNTCYNAAILVCGYGNVLSVTYDIFTESDNNRSTDLNVAIDVRNETGEAQGGHIKASGSETTYVCNTQCRETAAPFSDLEGMIAENTRRIAVLEEENSRLQSDLDAAILKSSPNDVKMTNTAHHGDFGLEPTCSGNGYRCMNEWIQHNGCEGYHVCSSDELTKWMQKEGGIQGNNQAFEQGWYIEGSFRDIDDDNKSNDCQSWTSSSELRRAPSWFPSGRGHVSISKCNSQLPVYCCL